MRNQNTKIHGGYIMMPRSIVGSELWLKPAWYFKVFTYIVMRVNHKPFNGLDRGCGFFNFSIEKIPNIKTDSIYRFLDWARSDEIQLLQTQKTTRGIIVKVNDYDRFQRSENCKMQDRSRDRNDTETRQKQDRRDTIYKNGKREKTNNYISDDFYLKISRR